MTDAIILIGIKHSGKSTQGKLLAKKSDRIFIDLDDVITELSGKTPREIYNSSGKDAFIQAEFLACEKVFSDYSGAKTVIATGGGICDNKKALEILSKMGKFVFLNVEEQIALSRILKKVVFEDGIWQNLPAYIAKENPSSQKEIQEIFHQYYKRRTNLYSKIADFTINLSQNDKEQNSALILDFIKNQV